MLLSPILLGISSLFSGVLQYFDRFLAYSLAPIFYNIGIIFGILFLAPKFGIMGVAYGVIFGSLLHLLIQLPPAYFSGFSYQPVLDLKQKELRRVLHLILPRIFGQATSMINTVVITALASLLAAGSISIFNLASHLQAFPVRVIGVAFAVASFPVFSRALAQEEKEKFFKSFSLVIKQVLFFIIPISVLVFLLRAQIVRLVLGTGSFGWEETQLTAASLGIFAFSFFAGALVHILVRVFFSFQDTKTPVVASLISMGVNIAFSFFFVWLLSFNNFFHNLLSGVLKLNAITNIEVVAFPLAILLSTVLQLFLLVYFLQKKTGEFRGLGLKKSLERTIFASFIMGVATFFVMRIVGNTIKLETFYAVFIQFSLASITALIVYILVLIIIKSPELSGILGDLFKRGKTEERV
jgi:putative peptidoglycan lipid II flippase